MKAKDLLKQEMTLANGETRKLGDVFVESDFGEIDNNDFITLNALLRVAKRVYGVRGYACNVVQAPAGDNGWCATVVARYELGGGKGFEEQSLIYDGAADCREGSTSPGFDKYMVALAESRAKARALRDALGVEICSKEEIARPGPQERVFTDGSGKAKIEATQAMIIRTKFMHDLGKTIEDIVKIIGREVDNIEQCTRDEASKVIEVFNKEKKNK